MAVALVFTLSRGAVVSVLVTVLMLLLVCSARCGRIRRSLVVLGALLVATVGYGAWIGLEPFLTRVWHADYAGRWVQDREQPADAARVPAARRGARRLSVTSTCATSRPRSTPGTRLLPVRPQRSPPAGGRARGSSGPCSSWAWAGGSAGISWAPTSWVAPRARSAEARPREPAGTIRSASALAVGRRWAACSPCWSTALFDFAARIPANGILAATCLGIATVALHTRFQARPASGS